MLLKNENEMVHVNIIKRNDMFKIFLQQILSNRSLVDVIVGKIAILLVSLN